MACKLYVSCGNRDMYLGQFKNQEKTKEHYSLIREKLYSELGYGVKPIYVEQGRGKGKC